MEKVLVTGGSGYIALHCIAELLKENYHVRTSLRNMERKEEVQKSVSKYLNENNSLEFCKLDLLSDDGWDNAVNGCEYVLHLASPVYEKDNSDESAFIEPAEQGLLRALRPSVEQKVKRFVMTSSIAAITQGHEEEKIDEKFWSKIEDSTMPYIKSKTLAEKALWNYINVIPKRFLSECLAFYVRHSRIFNFRPKFLIDFFFFMALCNCSNR